MNGASEFYCVVKSNLGADVVLAGKSNEWGTLRWTDELGNSIAPFFTSLTSGRAFLETISGWLLKHCPVSFVVAVILADIQHHTTFYTIDPVSTERFKALSPVQFLTELIRQKHPTGREMHEPDLEHPSIIPIEDFLGEGGDIDAKLESRRMLAAADLIFGIDVISRKQTIVYGRSSLEELLHTGHSGILGVLNVGVDQQSEEIDKLATLVQDVKGHHDYHGAGAR